MAANLFTGTKGRVAGLVIALLLVAGVGAFVMRARKPVAAESATTFETVSRRDLSQTVEASGTVEPLEVVEIKSKASGEILKMPVEVGSQVAKGQLLALVDPTNAQNAYAEAAAAQTAAEAGLAVARSARARADTLVALQLIAAVEHEAATLAEANARATLVRTRSALANARISLNDAQIRAPLAGTVLSQSVTQGQVITSATGNTSGGTALLTMADLTRVQIRAWVSETDIGQVHPGQSVQVTVDAFPKRTFEGKVLKIEPLAVVQQAVTMFSVLVSLPNDDRLLLPGMNGQVVVAITERKDVLTVPIDAVRTIREATALAATLGASTDSLRAGGGASGRARATAPAGAAATAGTGSGAGRGSVVFVQTPAGLVARRVALGANDYDYYEVRSGLAEGDQVVLLGVAQAAAKRAADQAQIRQRVSGMSGTIGSSSTKTAAPGAGGAPPPASGGR